MNFLGIDPDLHHIGIALVDENLRIVRVGQIRRPVTKAGQEPKGYEAVSIICREIRRHACAESPLENLMHSSYQITAGSVETSLVYHNCGRTAKNVDPNSIKLLSTVSGACYMTLLMFLDEAYLPLPSEWKGQAKKFASHWNILTAAGQNIEAHWAQAGTIDARTGEDRRYLQLRKDAPWELIPGGGGITPGNWKHVLDAVGLAQFTAKTYLAEQKKQKYLADPK